MFDAGLLRSGGVGNASRWAPQVMHSPDAIAEHIATTITSVYLRPAMYIGATGVHYSAHALDSLLRHLHREWTFATGRESELEDAITSVYVAEQCGAIGLLAAFNGAT